jgi:hypothetical protein
MTNQQQQQPLLDTDHPDYGRPEVGRWQADLDSRIDEAITELRAVGSRVTSANVADFVTDKHAANAVDATPAPPHRQPCP